MVQLSSSPLTNHSHMIDMRSDTVTRPTAEMREAMAAAIVGDDQYGEDPTVNELEARAAELMGKEAAVFVASGTMGNLTAVLAHCARGDEVILGNEAHIFIYESGSPAAVGGVAIYPIHTSRWGTFDLEEVEGAIREERAGYPRTGLLCVENTFNRCSGVVVPLDHYRDLREITARRGIPIHLDGARIFNAAAALGVTPDVVAVDVDSVQFCLSKGLGAPVGSLVAGSYDFIERVRRQRKLLGGAMRQAGVIAAAGLVAFDTMIERLPEDHRRARVIADGLSQIPGITVDLDVVHSNIVVFQQPEGVDKATFLDTLREQGLLVSNYGLKGLRIVTHYEITDGHVDEALSILERTATVLAGEPSRVIA
jgi:threonine aldolase